MAVATLADTERVILHYFDVHPKAMDTAEGIAGWWLLPSGVQMVQAALESLERRGLVRRCGPPDTPLFYRGPVQ